MEPRKAQLFLIMTASLVSGVLGILMGAFVHSLEFMSISIPGFAVGGLFAYKYTSYDKIKQRQEEHRRSRRNKH